MKINGDLLKILILDKVGMDSSQLENELRSERQIEGIRRAKKKGVYEMRDFLSVSPFLYLNLINY